MSAYLFAFMLPILLFPLRKSSRLAYVFLLAAAWALFAGLRVDIGGGDYFAYREFYDSLVGFHPGGSTMYRNWEPLFRLFAGCAKGFGLSWHGFLSCVALVGILPAVQVIDRHSKDNPLGLFVYGVEFMMYGSFVILRAGIAIGLGFLVVELSRERRFLTAAAVALIAAGFHYSGLFLLLYLPFAFELKPRLRIFLWGAVGLVGLVVAGLAIYRVDVPGHLAWRLLHYVYKIGKSTLNPLNILEILGVSWLIRRYASGAPPVLVNGFFLYMVFSLFATLEAIFVRIGSFFRLCIPLLYTFIVKAEPKGFLERRFGTAWVSAAIFLYYLAKIVRWLLLNGGGKGGFLPYRWIMGG